MTFAVNPVNGPVGVPMGDSLATAYGPKGYNAGDALAQRNALANTVLANAPIGVIDWNMSEFASETGYYVGGVYAALYILGAFQSTTGLDMCCLENINSMGIIGAIGNPAQGSSNSAVTAFGYVLGKAGQTVFGPEYSTTTSLSNLRMIATKPTPTTFAIMIVNADTANDQTLTITVSGGTPGASIASWSIGKSSDGAPTSPTPCVCTITSLASVLVPSETVMILTGTLS